MVFVFGIGLENVCVEEEKLNWFLIEFLSGGMDGQDGLMDVVGVIVDDNLIQKCMLEGVEVEIFLENNDSYMLFLDFDDGVYIVKMGLIGINVMDIQVLIVRFRNFDDF